MGELLGPSAKIILSNKVVEVSIKIIHNCYKGRSGATFQFGSFRPKTGPLFYGAGGNWINEATVQLLLLCSFYYGSTIM